VAVWQIESQTMNYRQISIIEYRTKQTLRAVCGTVSIVHSADIPPFLRADARTIWSRKLTFVFFHKNRNASSDCRHVIF